MKPSLLLLSLLACGALFAADAPLSTGVATSEFIFEKAPFPNCHAATLVETKSGLVAAWFGGTREGAKDVGIWSARQVDGKWTEPIEVATGIQGGTGQGEPCWNPVLFQPHSGPLMLFYKMGSSPSTWWVILMTSIDDGKTWAAGGKLPDGFLGPIKNKPVQLANGDIVCGTSTETGGAGAEAGWRVHFELISDSGKTWIKAAPPTDAAGKNGSPINAIQPSILVLPNGTLIAIGRTKEGKLFQTKSADQGQSWSALTLTSLPNPNSGTDAVTLKDGRHLLVYNHTAKGRSPLNVAVSSDGVNWSAALVLENTPGEYSYPCVIQTRDGRVHIAYTWKRTKIKHVVIDPEELEAKPIVNGEWPN